METCERRWHDASQGGAPDARRGAQGDLHAGGRGPAGRRGELRGLSTTNCPLSTGGSAVGFEERC